MENGCLWLTRKFGKLKDLSKMQQESKSWENSMLYVNADDLGWKEEITDRILDCYRRGRLHGASAMIFMKDSDRASELARENDLSVGLHINFTQDFSGEKISYKLRDKHKAVATYLKARKVNQILFNPNLCNAFDYVYQAQWEGFCRLYGTDATRIDGHQHMHLCMNMLASRRLRKGIKVRRNFSFKPGEKDSLNRLYRYLIDRWLMARFKCTDYFFSLEPINEDRIKRIVGISESADVELMVHPGKKEEYEFITSTEWERLMPASNFSDIGHK
jgi:predicted glycoside hydrolase/deacetylase ChbG (UPF0249 family)